jgi:type I restriction enzyme, S subunit
MTVTVLNGQQTKLAGLPDHWEETRMKAAVGRYQLKKNEDPEPVVLSLTKTGVKVKTDLAFGKSTENYVGHQIVEPGQFVFTPRDFDATPILCGISPTMGCISNLYLVFDVSADFDPRFLEYYFWGLKWGYDYFAQLSYGMRYSFNREQFERIPLAKPTLDEQRMVVRFLDRETGLIDGLIEKKTRFIALLKEKILNYSDACVTGRDDTQCVLKEVDIPWAACSTR